MVKKLIKYDFASYMRLLFPIQLVLIGIAAINRIVQIFEDVSSEVYVTIFSSSIVLYVIAIFASLLLTVIVAIVRFYQGMYTNEGYLSHTLPVTPAQHIFSKLMVSILFMLGTVLTIIVSLFIVSLGEMNIELIKSAGYLFGRAYRVFQGNLILYIIEFVLMVFFGFVNTMLKLYFCITVGQLAQKKKVLLAVGVYFGIYVLKQILSTLIIIFITLNYELMERIGEWIADNTQAFYHITLCGSLLITLIIASLYFFFTRLIMSRKLNLA